MKRTAALLVTASLLIPALLLVAPLGGSPAPRSAAAQTPEPALLTLLNFTDTTRSVTLESLAEGGQVVSSEQHPLGLSEALTLELAIGANPVTYRVFCSGCATILFGLAAGQRALVYVAEPGSPLAARSDLRVANESGAPQSGAIRTGAVLGQGRTLLPFRLDPEQTASVGVRLRDGQTIDLNLSCGPGCPPQSVRLGNGVDLEIPLR